MTAPPDVPPTGGSHEERPRIPRPSLRVPSLRRPWAIVTPAVFLLAGGLFAVSAANSEGTDLRPGRTTDLAGLVHVEDQHLRTLQAETRDLSHQVEALTANSKDLRVRQAQAQARQARKPAGLTRVSGPGITVTLSDAPREVRESSDEDINKLVVHQQDIQAVVNAMWAAGATAVTIEGQRVVTTTGIQCAGSTVQVNGLYFPQPYEISAVGDPAALEERIAIDGYLAEYRRQSETDDIQIGWALEQEDVVAPPYAGLVRPAYAKPLS
jgi:uncharacterized protein YlxW (UPF0749 family)